MAREAGKGHLRAGLPNDGVDYAEGSVFALQQDALLDVELQEAGNFVAHRAVFYLLWIQSEGCDCLRNGDSVYIIMSTLDSKKPVPVKFRQGGAW